MKFFNYLKAILSGFVFGLGQLLNRQYLKALFFFVFFAAFVGIEIGTSKYGKETNPYDKIEAADFDQYFFRFYYEFYESENRKDPVLEEYYNQITNNGTNLENWNQENVIKFLAGELKETSYTRYINPFTQEEIKKENFNQEVFSTPTFLTFFVDEQQQFYQEFIKKEENNNKVYKKIDPITGEILDQKEFLYQNSFKKYLKTANIALGYNQEIYFEIKEYTPDDNIGSVFYLKANDKSIHDSTVGLSKKVENNYYLFMTKNFTTIYQYYEAGMFANGTFIPYKGNNSTEIFKAFVKNQYNQLSNEYTEAQYKKFLLRTYFELDPTLREDFEERFDNFFYDKAGLFVKSYWAVFTLGQTSNGNYTEYNSLMDALCPTDLKVETSTILMGHVSVQVLLEGLIGVLLSVFFFIFGVWSIIDAYKVSKAKMNKKEVVEGTAYFKEVYEKSFEYIVLSPALFVLAFISIMPIIFGFILAFTSISGGKSMLECFDWVGLENFKNLFNFSSGLGSSFGVMFWKVLGWTVVWAVLSTGTVFFGGLFQALILNSEHVVFRKLWRSILILPWAIPAILSQMVFSVIFKETGLINQIVENLGFYELFRNMGILGSPGNPLNFENLNALQKFFYLGPENIKWFTNTDNVTFVRATLVMVNIWLGFPYFMALMSGVMTSIDKTLYEAAEIDGATKFQKTRLITFPLVLYSTAPILIMTFSGNFNNFGVIYFITQGGPNQGYANRAFAGDTDILISWMYKLTVDHSIYNMASVFSVLIFLVVGSVTAWNLSRTKAFKED